MHYKKSICGYHNESCEVLPSMPLPHGVYIVWLFI